MKSEHSSPPPPGKDALERAGTLLAPRREIFGWAMFDFANQAYTLLIITVIFGDLFTRVVVGDAPDYRRGNLLWSFALSTSYLLVVACAPVAGAIMDYTASKKRFLFVSYLLTVATTGLLYFVAPGYAALGVVLLILSNFAYSIGEAFIASFLPELGPPRSLGRISGFGWALGYVGGLVSAALALQLLGEVSAANFDRIRWVGPLAAAFFLLAAIPTFVWVRERGVAQPGLPAWGYLRFGLSRVRDTVRRVQAHRDLATMLGSTFFAMNGIYIIITFAFIYGAQVVKWDEGTRTTMFILVQLTAAAGALGFGWIQDRLGAVRTYRITLWMWIVAVALIFLTPTLSHGLRRLGLDWQPQHVFLVVGCAAGMSLGSCQSATRTLVGLFSPLSRSAEFFGFWGLTLKLAGASGLLIIGLLQVVLGLRTAVLCCVALFLAAWVISLRVDQARGEAAAREPAAPTEPGHTS
jgi:MFS transporter, UMF1 family